MEMLERTTRGQHVVVDPLLHDKRFQDKWKCPSGTYTTMSTQQLVSEQNPPTSKFYPPMFISRVRVAMPSPSPLPLSMSQSSSAPVMQLKSSAVCMVEAEYIMIRFECLTEFFVLCVAKSSIDSPSAQHDSEILRRSLSRVTLKRRIEASRATTELPSSSQDLPRKRNDSKAPKPVYFAIST